MRGVGEYSVGCRAYDFLVIRTVTNGKISREIDSIENQQKSRLIQTQNKTTATQPQAF